MPIPTIEPYPMPTGAGSPDSPLRWVADPARAILLIHDMQRYFVAPFEAGGEPLVTLVANIAALRERCAALDVPVAYTAQPGSMTPEQRGLLNDVWGPGMTVAEEDRAVVDELAPAEGDAVFTKWRYSAFFNSGLRDFMRERGRDQIVVCGVYAHVGVLMTCLDAFTFDIQPFLVTDAVADFSEAYHRMAVTYAAERCALTAPTKEVLRMLSTGADS
ncbi:isochorismatase family protein [Saccharothrix sp. S26]|uniref:isochorismatase family protein n=1 Tax=Saccharothrix sp. S26 TaxID=2907215 RepID=UPI001F22E348|nr:isochorismatase family protein [Saccharothrix sp. S26]MCE6996408.1 isochorismatase family protein [Saccharothrix sp. S26]